MATRVRRADNGQFTTKEYMVKHKKTTVEETIKPKCTCLKRKK